MQKIANAAGIVVIISLVLAVMVLPAWYLLENPELLATLQPVPVSPEPASTRPASTPVLATFEPVQIIQVGDLVTVAYDSVNVRRADHSSTGKIASKGSLLAVSWQPDGWGLITDGEFAGLYIWRGCTSDPAGFKCLKGGE